MDDQIAAVQLALEARDWATLGRLLHPYLHWTQDGVTVRGRSKVLALLAASELPEPPDTYELRDGQVYRWTIGPEPAGNSKQRPT